MDTPHEFLLINKVALGQKVNKGQLLGEISNPVNDEVEMVYAPFNAVVLGRAQDQFVSAGYAVFNLGERRSIEDLGQQGEEVKKKVVKKTEEQMGLSIEKGTLPKTDIQEQADLDKKTNSANKDAQAEQK